MFIQLVSENVLKRLKSNNSLHSFCTIVYYVYVECQIPYLYIHSKDINRKMQVIVSVNDTLTYQHVSGLNNKYIVHDQKLIRSFTDRKWNYDVKILVFFIHYLKKKTLHLILMVYICMMPTNTWHFRQETRRSLENEHDLCNSGMGRISLSIIYEERSVLTMTFTGKIKIIWVIFCSEVSPNPYQFQEANCKTCFFSAIKYIV